ncbi:MAG: response regulator [Campylobacterales bacterium]|nr:response regulator [Campylobacterales bacterium]
MQIDLLREYTRTLNILYVEDDLAMRLSTAELMEDYFKRVDTAGDGVAGIARFVEYFKREGHYYDLVVADLNMPRKGGIEMIKEMLALRQEQSVIVLSAHNEVENLIDAIELGVASFIIKPLQLEPFSGVLYRVAKAITERKLLQMHLERAEQDNVTLCAENRRFRKEMRVLQARLSKYEVALHVTPQLSVKTNGQSERYEEQIRYLIRDDLEELRMVIDAMEEHLGTYVRGEQDFKSLSEQFGVLLQHFGSTLAYYNFFERLGGRIGEFAQTMLHEPLNSDECSREQLLIILESFLNMLRDWQTTLPDADLERLNFFDVSIISDIDTILLFWHPEELQRSAPIEFFA